MSRVCKNKLSMKKWAKCKIIRRVWKIAPSVKNVQCEKMFQVSKNAPSMEKHAKCKKVFKNTQNMKKCTECEKMRRVWKMHWMRRIAKESPELGNNRLSREKLLKLGKNCLTGDLSFLQFIYFLFSVFGHFTKSNFWEVPIFQGVLGPKGGNFLTHFLPKKTCLSDVY